MKSTVVLGNPGTGKTYNIIKQLQTLRKKYKSSEIVVLSHTKVAAKEIADRVGDRSVRASTIHSLAYRLGNTSKEQVVGAKDLRDFSEEIGIPMKGVSIDSMESTEVGDDYIAIVGLSINKLEDPIDYYKKHSVHVGNFSEFEYFYNSYKLWKKTYGYVDFNDMIMNAINGAQEDGIDFSVLLVDEAQDLSPLQWSFINKIIEVGQIQEIIITGDPDQALFIWGGADPNGMGDFIKKYDARVHELDQSYRVPQAAFSVGKRIISKVKNRYEKSYKPTEKAGSTEIYSSPQYFDFDKLSGDTLILYRNHALRREIEDELIYKNIPYSCLNGKWGLCEGNIAKAIKTINKIASMGPDDTIPKADLDHLKRNASERGLKFINNGQLANLADHRPSEMLNIPYMLWGYFDYVDLSVPPNIKLSTIHGAKGMEADTVVILDGMTQRVIDEMELNPDVEANVWYVAVTRTKDKLIWINSNEATGYMI